MTDINQTNNKEMQVSEFENLLQVYTEHTLKNDSSLPPQTRVVKETVDGIYGRLNASETSILEKFEIIESNFNQLKSTMASKVTNNLDTIVESIETEVRRAKGEEQELFERIKKEKDRLDDFFLAAEVGDIAIDTLVEIQK
jgi:predicted  nucleic acid-binding Zn-ribbon protein